MERYSGQLGIAQIGTEGQKRLLASSVLVIGAGGLGSALLYCLAAAGVGRITVVDDDRVRLSNLNRQYLYNMNDIESYKADAAAGKLRALNPDIRVEVVKERFAAENAGTLVEGHDIVLTAADNLITRLDANRACVSMNIPLVNGGISGMYGSVQAVRPHETACLACLHGAGEEAGTTAYSFAPVVTCISALMAQAALLLLLGVQNPPGGSIVYYDGLDMTMESVSVERIRNCPHCGTR